MNFDLNSNYFLYNAKCSTSDYVFVMEESDITMAEGRARFCRRWVFQP